MSEVKEHAAAGEDELRGSQDMLPEKVLAVNNCLLASDSNQRSKRWKMGENVTNVRFEQRRTAELRSRSRGE